MHQTQIDVESDKHTVSTPLKRRESIIDNKGSASHVTPTPEKVRKAQRHHTLPGSDNKVVNVINSTKIIIKGINVNAAAVAAAKVESAEAEPPKLQANEDDQLVEVIVVDKNESKDETIGDQSSVSEEQIENNLDIPSTTTTLRTSTPKLNRECMLLQRTVNESKMLTEYMNDTESRARKAKRASGAVQRHVEEETSDNESAVSSRGAGSQAADRSRSRSRSRNQSPGSSDGRGPRRSNMRSQNAEFSAKHQKFLMGIQQQHQDSDASETTDHELDGNRSLISMDGKGGGEDGDLVNDTLIAPKVSLSSDV